MRARPSMNVRPVRAHPCRLLNPPSSHAASAPPFFVRHRCTGVSCAQLPPLDSGASNLTNDGTFPSTVAHSCLPGYELGGDAARTCREDGVWTHRHPTCRGTNMRSVAQTAYSAHSAHSAFQGATCDNVVCSAVSTEALRLMLRGLRTILSKHLA